MSLTDKVTGKVKQAAGDLTGDASLRREGTKEERRPGAQDRLASHRLAVPAPGAPRGRRAFFFGSLGVRVRMRNNHPKTSREALEISGG